MDYQDYLDRMHPDNCRYGGTEGMPCADPVNGGHGAGAEREPEDNCEGQDDSDECGQCGAKPGSPDLTCDTCVGSESQWVPGDDSDGEWSESLAKEDARNAYLYEGES